MGKGFVKMPLLKKWKLIRSPKACSISQCQRYDNMRCKNAKQSKIKGKKEFPEQMKHIRIQRVP